MKNKFFLIVFMFFSYILFSETHHIYNESDFEEKLKATQSGDEIVLMNDIRLNNNYEENNGYKVLTLNGITINGNGHRLKLIGRNLSLNGNTTFKNVKMTLAIPDASSNDNGDLSDYSKTSKIYANGNDLTLDNVSFTPEANDVLPVRPTIIMGTKNGTNDTNRDNVLTIKNSQETVELRTIVAGSESGTKATKTSIILDDKVEMKGTTNNTIVLKNINGTPVKVDLINKSNKVRTFDASDQSTEVNITLENIKYTESKRPEFKGKINELNLNGGTNVTLYTPLDVNTLKLNVTDQEQEAPEIKVSKNISDDDYSPSQVNGSIKANKIVSNNNNSKIILDQDGTINSTTVEGRLIVDSNGSNASGTSNFTGYNENVNGVNSSNNSNTPSEPTDNTSSSNNNLEQIKAEINASIDNLSNLTQEQKNSIKEEVKLVSNEEALEPLRNKANSLNTSMGEMSLEKEKLNTLISNNEEYNKVRTSDNQLNTEIENILSNTEKYEKIRTKELVDNLKTQLTNLITKVKEKIKELEVNEKKQQAKNEIDNLKFLEETEKTQFKIRIDQSNEENVDEVIQEATRKNNKNKENLKNDIESDLSDAQKNTFNASSAENLSKLKEIKSLVDEFKSKIEEIKILKNTLSTLKENIDYDNIKDENFKQKLESLINLNTDEITNLEVVNIKIEDIESMNQKLNKVISIKRIITEELTLTDKQKDEAIKKLNESFEEDTLSKVVLDVKTLSEEMKILNNNREILVALKEKLNDDLTEEEKRNIEEILNKYNNYDNISTTDKIKELNKEMIDKISELNIKKKIDLSPYHKYIDIFNYTNIDIVNSLDKPSYLNVSFGKNITGIKELIGSFNTGFNYEIMKNLKIGAFIGYEKDLAHQIYLGTNVSYKDVLSFIRYRLSKHENILNHNIDTYLKYSKSFYILDNFTIKPIIGMYFSYSPATNIDENVKLNQKFIFLVDAQSKFNYDLKGYNIYITPGIKAGYNKGSIEQVDNPENKFEKSNGYFIYSLETGLNKQFNNILTNANINISGTETGIFKIKANIGIGYKF